MNCTKIFGAVAIFAIAMPALAASTDPVVASFERMLDHRPLVVAGTVPPGFPADPLVAAVREPLWRGTPAMPASFATQYRPRETYLRREAPVWLNQGYASVDAR